MYPQQLEDLVEFLEETSQYLLRPRARIIAAAAFSAAVGSAEPNLGNANNPAFLKGGVPCLLTVLISALFLLLPMGCQTSAPVTTVPTATALVPNIAESDRLLVLARKSFDQRHYQEALQYYRDSQQARVFPDAAIQNETGQTLARLELYQQALRHYSQSIELNENAATRVNRGFALIATGRWQEARNDAQVALDIISHGQESADLKAQAHEILAYSHAKLQKHENALAHVDQAVTAIADAGRISGSWVQRLSHFVDMVNEVRRKRGTSLDIVVYPALNHMTEAIAWVETGNQARAQGLLEKGADLHLGDSWFIESMMAKSAGQMGHTERAYEKHLWAVTLRDGPAQPGNRTEIVQAVNECPVPESYSTIYGPHPWSACPSEQVTGTHLEDRAEAIASIYQEAKQREAATPIPSPTLQPTPLPPPTTKPTPTPIPTSTPIVPTPMPTPTATPTLRPPTATPTVTPTPTPVPDPELRHLEEKQYMLELINTARQSAGLGAVTLGDNIAAQLHAESSLDNCFSAHWGTDGLKPYMRYSLAGGYQSNAENGSGLDYCIRAADGYRANLSIKEEIREAMQGLMDSPGHRRNILNKWHKKVNLGLAWDRYNLVILQHFEGDYVEYDSLPSLKDGELTLAGETKNGAGFSNRRDLSVTVFFDPPPHPLTRGQLARTYCYSSGLRVAGLRERLTGGSYWTTHDYTTTMPTCPDPYDVPASAPGPRSPNEAHAFWREAYIKSNLAPSQAVTVPWVDAETFEASGKSFSIRADLKDIVRKHGDGVYTILVWAKSGGESLLISEYSIFYGTDPPDTYSSK